MADWRLTGRAEWRLYPHGNSGWLSVEWSNGTDTVWRWRGDGPPSPAQGQSQSQGGDQ